MGKIFSYITKNFITVLGITILTGTTLTTSAIGVLKVANNFEKTKLEVPEVKGAETVVSSSPTPTLNPLDSNSSGGNSGVIPHPKGTIPASTAIVPTIAATSTASTAQTGTSTSGCAITLFGKQYDVSGLRNTHSGGNIFNCGTDMTAVYQGRHGTDLSRMSRYLISSGGTTSSTTSSNTSGNTGTSTSGGGQTPSSTGGSQSGGGSTSSSQPPQPNSTITPKPQEVHHEDDHNEQEDTNHNEDDGEERKTHLETFLHQLIELLAS